MTSKISTKKEIDALKQENEKLRKTIESLRAVNSEQLKRLITAELLKVRIRELEQVIADKKGK